MLNFQEFQEYVQENLNEMMPDEYKNADVQLNKVTKNNGVVLSAVSVRPADTNVAPNIYLEGFFKKYEKGEELDMTVAEIAKVAVENIKAPESFATIGEDFQNFDMIKDKIIMVAVNAERNKDLLEKAPHEMREDLALIYKVAIGTNSTGIATITIKNSNLAMWNTTTEEIHQLAMENTRKILPITVQSMNEVIKEMFANGGVENETMEALSVDLPIKQQMFIISNKEKMNGAASIFYEDALSELAEKMGTDLYILPSSVHECIAVSTDMGTPESLAAMVHEVNSTQVCTEEQLSDHVYRYDAKNKTISLADTTIDEIEAKAAASAENVEAKAEGGPKRRSR